jgi:hypothetical protein
MTSFTKGPWVAKFDRTDDGDEYIRIELPDDGFCGDEYMSLSGIGSYANARLIQDAPKLYDALTEFIEQWNGFFESELVRRQRSGLLDDHTKERILRVRALLSRIDGEIP